MRVIITDWALQSYLDLKSQAVFTVAEYKQHLRPDAQLLKDGYPSPHTKFQNAKFWSPAESPPGQQIQNGYKMKWRNLGPGKVQLRLPIALLGGDAYLCHSYVKDAKSEPRHLAKFKARINQIAIGQFAWRGDL